MILAALSFSLASATFKPHATMPLATVYTQCGGQNRSPELHWSGAPKGTKSFALIVHDPDAPHPGGWYHWVAYNIPPSQHELRDGYNAGIGVTDLGKPGYNGPCPPPGKPHHYDFTLYALDIARVHGRYLSGPQLQAVIATHVLAQTTLTGMYGRKP